ncbi:Ribosomal RNA small subunit methyltransferase H [bioreactor metagenome]|mgnify:FL=1|jgi:16S rRNA (cytosine1402-N4)-methyltransferase|uniref:Ribosomal RNA small subunit methyltransferase H n=1 Tax=bioreactor metagenome TaxID=1076179 RepID=A0A644T8N5_9ZZZZ|nr:16S rRNA (cytosine(1402)-N(4))-methyltransferase RsmH [Lentimicrobium sp.]MEA5109359.1 16S rRNA (cytosine(1402)-N(4))-methyltransferase RsmH [Lentimicrobium sp.]
MYHNPVMLKECIDGLAIDPAGTYVDLTFGGGGHSRAILGRLTTGRLIAFDQDTDALSNAPDDPRFTLVNQNFRYLVNFLRLYKAVPVAGILADLGISSYQIDQAERGFSTRFDAELDLRMDRKSGLTARQVINHYTSDDLIRIFRQYGELPNAYRIAMRIADVRGGGEIITTTQLKDILQPLAERGRENKFFARVFQALRIEVNAELDVLKEMLTQTIKVLKPGGRLVVLTYHSLEDRPVKNFMKTGNFEGIENKDFFGNLIAPFRPVNRKPIVAGEEELSVNNRARSAKLRVAERSRNE